MLTDAWERVAHPRAAEAQGVTRTKLLDPRGAMPKTSWIRISQKFLAEEAKHGFSLDARIGTIEHIVSDGMLKEFCACETDTLEQITALLDDPQARHFVKMVVFTARDVPRTLLEPLLLAGARTANPSFNKHFIWPCVICHGRRPVVRELIRIFRSGSADERAGAAHALYWGAMGRGAIYWPHDDRGRPSGEEDDPVDDLLAEFEASALTEFLNTGDVHIRRVLIAHLPKRTSENADMFEKVVAAARASDDAYIRQRLAYQLGESDLIPCLLNRDELPAAAG